MTHGVRVNYSRHERYTRAPAPEDKWDTGDRAADISIEDISICTHGDFLAPFPLERGKTYYLVWADYSTGDSFGREDNCIDFIDLFINKQLAEKAVEALLEEPPASNNWMDTTRYSRTYIREGLTYITTLVPWVGFFEHLNDINITEVICT